MAVLGGKAFWASPLFHFYALLVAGLAEVLLRFGQLALLSERVAQVVVGVGIIRLEAQGLPEVLARLGRLALISAHNTQTVLGDRRLGIHGKDMGPKSPRVMRDLDLVPSENSQPEDETYGNACNRQRCRCSCLRRSQGSPAEQRAGAG